MLQKGSEGSQVTKLQSDLVALGFDIPVDGDFGPKTETAVKQFQKLQGLVVDGVAGPKTFAAIAKALDQQML